MTTLELRNEMMKISPRKAKMTLAYLSGVLVVSPEKPLDAAIEEALQYESWMEEKGKGADLPLARPGRGSG